MIIIIKQTKEKTIMRRQIRRGVFETNSSSTHSITMCTSSDYDKWKKGELVWDRWNCQLVPITDKIKEEMKDKYSEYLTYDQFYDWNYIDFETFTNSYVTPSGEKVVAFGYYGYDG
jgi:hypothetical protein